MPNALSVSGAVRVVRDVIAYTDYEGGTARFNHEQIMQMQRAALALAEYAERQPQDGKQEGGEPVAWRDDAAALKAGVDLVDHAVNGDPLRRHEWRAKLLGLCGDFADAVYAAARSVRGASSGGEDREATRVRVAKLLRARYYESDDAECPEWDTIGDMQQGWLTLADDVLDAARAGAPEGT
jgi:hypothetical protein